MVEQSRTFLTVTEVAWHLGIARSTAHAWIAAGVLPSIKVAGRARVPQRALAERIAGRERAALDVTRKAAA